MTEVVDWRALSLLETEQPTLMEIAGGVAFTLAAFVTIPGLALLSALFFGGVQSIFGGGIDELPPPPIEVIEARFVRLGKRREPRKLPSKEIPEAQETAPVPQAPESEPMAAVPTGQKEKGLAKPKKKRTERDEDLLSQLGERAGAISDLTKGPELEGDPDGIVEGTEATGDELQIYLGKLYSYFRRGWQVPTALTDEELQKLACVIELSVTKDGRVGEYEVKRPSGNEVFDESVRRRMSQAEGSELPGPPESVANRIYGETISLRFFGRHAR